LRTHKIGKDSMVQKFNTPAYTPLYPRNLSASVAVVMHR
jgi:hypothetical protein